MCSRIRTEKSTEAYWQQIERLRMELLQADAVVIGAGSGLSAAAGFTYSGERFEKYFGDFAVKYGIRDMYSGGFYPYATLAEYWAWWSRQIYYNRYVDIPEPVYEKLLELIKDKDYFVLTTNVDHCFQKVGFAKERLFYTQGDYGLWQCAEPCHEETYDNEAVVRQMIAAQKNMSVPEELIPYCPKCGKPMTMNLRCDDTFVEDQGWRKGSERYRNFIQRQENRHVLFWELGVGMNTPGIIKYPFWQMTAKNPNAVYVCINYNEAYAPAEIVGQSICLNGELGKILRDL